MMSLIEALKKRKRLISIGAFNVLCLAMGLLGYLIIGGLMIFFAIDMGSSDIAIEALVLPFLIPLLPCIIGFIFLGKFIKGLSKKSSEGGKQGRPNLLTLVGIFYPLVPVFFMAGFIYWIYPFDLPFDPTSSKWENVMIGFSIFAYLLCLIMSYSYVGRMILRMDARIYQAQFVKLLPYLFLSMNAFNDYKFIVDMYLIPFDLFHSIIVIAILSWYSDYFKR